MLFESSKDLGKRSELHDAMSNAYRSHEDECVNRLLENIQFNPQANAWIADRARELVAGVKDRRKKQSAMDDLMTEYDLSSSEGIALMCLAEALLRIPDSYTINSLLSDKLGNADWKEHISDGKRFFVNAMTWSLLWTGKIFKNKNPEEQLGVSLMGALKRLSGPAVRKVAKSMMQGMGKLFVMGATIEDATKRARELEKIGYSYSYDMLGEAAYTQADAEKYYQRYEDAIHAIGKSAEGKGIIDSAGISVKLSALHPRYEVADRERVMEELAPKLLKLTLLAKDYDIALTVDAEEADRLDLSLEIIEDVFLHEELEQWEGLGLALQAYQKRAYFVIDYLVDLAQRGGRRLMVRLVKGAYWDTEVKLTQELGLESYPVFTRKNSTDVSYLACAKKLLANDEFIYPRFATHNAQTLAAILQMTQGKNNFEFQCLHGMGQTLYDQIIADKSLDIPVRIYAPVGGHAELLPYLVRRLLENGANTSFVNLIGNEDIDLDDIIADPIERISALEQKAHPKIPSPVNLYGEGRSNSTGIDLSNTLALEELKQQMEAEVTQWQAVPMVAGEEMSGKSKPVLSPTNGSVVGSVIEANDKMIEQALVAAEKAYPAWTNTAVETRAECLDKVADLLQQQMPKFMTIATLEAGKTIPDCISEVREAIDFCRYYAMCAREKLVPQNLPGPTGEFNQLYYNGRGTILCISPWNFPLAIFLGQVVAALVAGNCVIAKPAEQTPLISAEMVKLLYQAGIPKSVIQLLPGSGAKVGGKLVADERIKGVMFTGSTEVAKLINQTLANRKGAIVPFIAETGGQNAMIVDSSALAEQVVADVLASSFGSAGQRCSALRVLFLQTDIADRVLEMLQGAMKELSLGDPSLLKTDIGPVIDQEALKVLQKHAKKMKRHAKLIYELDLPQELSGTFMPPCAFELKNLQQLEREVFGPVLHIIRFKAQDIDQVIEQINATQYGLTFGVHSRIDHKVQEIYKKVHVGNAYVNRNMIGAVVGVQPFGGEGLSGTGPKAGGPNYLMRLVAERTITIDTTAAGGNASLLTLEED